MVTIFPKRSVFFLLLFVENSITHYRSVQTSASDIIHYVQDVCRIRTRRSTTLLYLIIVGE